jgi:hypothetical protein
MKKIIITSLICLTMSTLTSAQAVLGLAERRAVKEYQDSIYPEIKKGIEAAAGFGVELDVKWEQIAKLGESDIYKLDEYWALPIFTPLTKALASIASDKMGKDELKAKLKKIVIMYNEKTAPASNFPEGLTFVKGILTINWKPYDNTNPTFVLERVKAIKDLIESNL